MRARIIIVAVSVVALFSGCKTSERTLARMERAQALVDSLPAEAYDALTPIRRRHLHSREDRARYALLMSEVADKNDMTVANDSLISIAVRYYDAEGTPRQRALSYYYLARAFEDMGHDSLALSACIKSQRLADEACDWHISGLAASTFGRFYDQQQLNAKAAEAYTLAVDAFTKADERRNLMYVYLNRSASYTHMLKFDEAIADDSLALALATELRDTVWIDDIYSSLAKDIFYKTEAPQPSLDILHYNYRTYRNGEPPIWDYSILYQLYEASGKPDSAMYFLNLKFENRDRFPLSAKPGMYILLSQAARLRGNYDKAFEYYEMCLEYSDSVHLQIQQTALQEVEHRLRFDLVANENAKLRAEKRAETAILASILACAAVVALYFVLKIKRERRERREQIDELMAAIDASRHNKIALVAELDEHVERERRLKVLLEERFNELRQIAANYYTYAGDANRLNKEISKLTSLDYFNDEAFATIEAVVDAKNSDVLAHLRRQFDLKTSDIRLLSLVYAGFTNEEISVILDLSVANTAVRKTRLRQRLADFCSRSDDYRF